MKIAILALLAAFDPHIHYGWDIIAQWGGPGWYAELGHVPVMGPFGAKAECRAERFESPSTCRYVAKKEDFPQVMPVFPDPPGKP